MSLITLFITSILSQNIILTKFLGVCPFLTVSNRRKSAIGMGLAVTIVIFISSIITFLINKYILIPTNATFLQTIVFIFVIATFVQIIELYIKKNLKHLYDLLGIYLPLIATNCAVLGIILINTRSSYTFLESIVFALGSSIGFTLVLYIFSSIRERLNHSPVIQSFRGIPIALITAGIMALIFARFGG